MNWIADKFVIERFLGAALYCLVVLIAFVAIRNHKFRINKILNVLLLTLVIMAFFYVPTETADLYRWRSISYRWANLSFRDFYSKIMLGNSTPLGMLMIYVCNKTGVNGVLPALCALIFYENLFHILKSTDRKYHFSSATLSIVFFYLMCTGRFLEVISGVRNMVAFSIAARCIADEELNGKSVIRNGVWYLVACLIHSTIIPIVAIRLILLLFSYNRKILIWLIDMAFVGIALVFFSRHGDKYIAVALAKGKGFIEFDVYSYFWEYVITAMQMTLTIYGLVKYYKIDFVNKKDLRTLALWGTMLTVTELVLFFSYSIFQRYAGFCSFLMPPILAAVLEERKKDSYLAEKNAFIICCLTMLHSAIRGNLCAYKFFVL